MSVPTDALAALHAALTEYAREISSSYRTVLPGHETSPSEWPEAVRSAQDLHAGILQHGELGDVHVRVGCRTTWVADGCSSPTTRSPRWGVAEVYSAHGESVAAGVYLIHGPVLWQELGVVRQVAIGYQAPFHLIPKDAPLEWVTHGSGEAMQYESVGGRYFIVPTNPDGDPNPFLLCDGLTNLQHPCDSAEAARARALAILTES